MVTASFFVCGTGITVFMLVIAIGISLSRFYLQAHYLTDVLCGIILGILSGVLMVRLTYVILNAINPILIK